MAQSFIKRFAGRETEAVARIKLFGWRRFCEDEGISGYALQSWFQRQKGCENDSIYRYISSDSPVHDLPLAKQLLLAVKQMQVAHNADMAKVKTDCANLLAEKDRVIEQLKENDRFRQLDEYKRLEPVFEICREYIRSPVRI